MKILSYGKDGGEYSTVWGYWLIEIKKLFSIVLLCFENGSREAYHEHAFNCLNWVIKGELYEELMNGSQRTWKSSWLPFVIRKDDFHKVTSKGRTWVISIRGPWRDMWREYNPKEEHYETLTHGRKLIARYK